MERIVIEVDEATASKWNAATEKTKTSTSKKINEILKYALNKDEQDMLRLLNKIGEEAAANGLTPEIFQEIMELDDQTMKNLFGEEFKSAQDAFCIRFPY